MADLLGGLEICEDLLMAGPLKGADGVFYRQLTLVVKDVVVEVITILKRYIHS